MGRYVTTQCHNQENHNFNFQYWLSLSAACVCLSVISEHQSQPGMQNHKESILNISDIINWCPSFHACTWAVWKFRGFFLLFRVGTLWRCGDGLLFEVPPLASDALLTTLHSLLENVLQTVGHLEISCLRAPFSWLEKPRNRMGRGLDCMMDVLMDFHRSTIPKTNTEFNTHWTFLSSKLSAVKIQQ
jgi:hypothetical protein